MKKFALLTLSCLLGATLFSGCNFLSPSSHENTTGSVIGNQTGALDQSQKSSNPPQEEQILTDYMETLGITVPIEKELFFWLDKDHNYSITGSVVRYEKINNALKKSRDFFSNWESGDERNEFANSIFEGQLSYQKAGIVCLLFWRITPDQFSEAEIEKLYNGEGRETLDQDEVLYDTILYCGDPTKASTSSSYYHFSKIEVGDDISGMTLEEKEETDRTIKIVLGGNKKITGNLNYNSESKQDSGFYFYFVPDGGFVVDMMQIFTGSSTQVITLFGGDIQAGSIDDAQTRQYLLSEDPLRVELELEKVIHEADDEFGQSSLLEIKSYKILD